MLINGQKCNRPKSQHQKKLQKPDVDSNSGRHYWSRVRLAEEGFIWRVVCPAAAAAAEVGRGAPLRDGPSLWAMRSSSTIVCETAEALWASLEAAWGCGARLDFAAAAAAAEGGRGAPLRAESSSMGDDGAECGVGRTPPLAAGVALFVVVVVVVVAAPALRSCCLSRHRDSLSSSVSAGAGGTAAGGARADTPADEEGSRPAGRKGPRAAASGSSSAEKLLRMAAAPADDDDEVVCWLARGAGAGLGSVLLCFVGSGRPSKGDSSRGRLGGGTASTADGVGAAILLFFVGLGA